MTVVLSTRSTPANGPLAVLTVQPVLALLSASMRTLTVVLAAKLAEAAIAPAVAIAIDADRIQAVHREGSGTLPLSMLRLLRSALTTSPTRTNTPDLMQTPNPFFLARN